MASIQLAFYRNSKSTFGKLIRLQQRVQGIPGRSSMYSHVEIVFEDGYWFSSSEQDKGVRKKKIVDNKNNWDYLRVPLTDEQEELVRDWCESQIANRYNWWGIFFCQVLKTMWFIKPHDYFCSQYCAKALQRVSILCGVDAITINPGRLREEVLTILK